jgi:HK97 family phage portal protein
MANWLTNLFRPSAAKAAEGEYRPGPWQTLEGLLPHSWGSSWNFWQRGYDPIPNATTSAMVEACVSAYSQTIAMCPGDHWRTLDNGGRERVTNSALTRILRRPNSYQTISDFLLNTTRCLFTEGNAYALALRNDRFEISELHLMHPRHCAPRVAENGELFYALGGNDVVDARFGGAKITGAPARDVLHIRLHTPTNPLKGESPLAAVLIDVAMSGAMSAQQLAFYQNQSKPSGILSTDQVLTLEQAKDLREIWNEQTSGLNAGKTPITTAGLKWQAVSASASDAQLADVMKMTEQHIALAFRVPLPILGLGATTFSSTELLMQQWVASGLGFALNHIEEAFGQLFNLKGQPDEYLEFDTAALLRSALKDRMDALVKGVQGGILAPNEARRSEGYAAVEFGDEPRVQQQVVPLSAWSNPQPTTPASDAAPAAPPTNDNGPAAEDTQNAERDYSALIDAAAKRYAH